MSKVSTYVWTGLLFVSYTGLVVTAPRWVSWLTIFIMAAITLRNRA